MSVTCCPLSGADGEGPSCSTSARPKARKEHYCCECAEVISVGSVYEYVTGIWDGSAGTHKTCLSTARGAFAVLWDSINHKRAPWASNPWAWAISFERTS